MPLLLAARPDRDVYLIRRDSLLRPELPLAAAVAAQVKVGDRVLVRMRGHAQKQRGTVRFVGETAFKEGPWVGVELDSAVGKNDGSVEGTRYFNTIMPDGSRRVGHDSGIFVRPSYVTLGPRQPLNMPGEPPTPRVAAVAAARRRGDGVADALRDLMRDIDDGAVETTDEIDDAIHDATGEIDEIDEIDGSESHGARHAGVEEDVSDVPQRRTDVSDEWRLRLDGLSPPTNINGGGSTHGGGTSDVYGGGTCTCQMASWLVQLLSHRLARLAALRTIGNVVATEPAAQTQAVLDCGLLPALRTLLEAGGSDKMVRDLKVDEAIVREAAFVASNLLAGTPQQVERTLRAGIAPLLFAYLNPRLGVGVGADGDAPMATGQFWPRTNWAAVAIANVLLRGQRAQVALVVAQGCDTRCE